MDSPPESDQALALVLLPIPHRDEIVKCLRNLRLALYKSYRLKDEVFSTNLLQNGCCFISFESQARPVNLASQESG
jgi:hypothetical protein